MPYDSTVPNAANEVRGVSGDLAKMQQNFAALEPVIASGLNALLSGGTAASGDVAVAQGTGNAQWHYQSLAALAAVLLSLDDLSDVSAPSPSNGEVLKWNGSAWAPAADLAGAGGGGGAGDFNVCRVSLPSGGTSSVPNNTLQAVSGLVERENTDSAWTVTSSGTIKVPLSGVTHVQIFAQCTWEDTAPVGGNSFRELFMERGPGIGGIAVRLDSASGNVSIRNRLRAVNNAANLAVSPVFPVSGGEEYKLLAWQNDGGALDLLGGTNANGALTAMTVRGFDFDSAGSAGLLYKARISMASGDTYTVPDSTLTTWSGATVVERENVGGWTVDTGSGFIQVPTGKGITHVECTMQAAWGGVATPGGFLDVVLALDDNVPISSGLEVRDRRSPEVGTGVPIQSLSSPLIPVSGGEKFSLKVIHDHGSDRTLVGGSTAGGGLTYLDVRGYILVSGT